MHATANSACPVFDLCREFRVETVVTGERRQYLENGMERMLRSSTEVAEMTEKAGITSRPKWTGPWPPIESVICNWCVPS